MQCNTYNFNVLSRKLQIFLIIFNVYLLSSTTNKYATYGILAQAINIEDQITTTTIIATNQIDKNATTTTVAATMSPARLRPPRVKLNKCCHFNEYLNTNKECRAGSSALWVPIIFLINRRTYYEPKGKAPNHISFDENTQPQNCKLEQMELFAGSSKFVVFSNGSLFLRERSQFIQPSDYCVDSETAMVCSSHITNNHALKLRKCCGQYALYDAKNNSCVFGPEHAVTLQLPLSLSNEIKYETIYGFPNCAHEQLAQKPITYANLADVEAARFDYNSGQILVGGKNLTVDEYCLEHLQGNNAVNIFTCLHHFGKPNISTFTAMDSLLTAVLKAGVVISVIFLAATLVAGYMMPSAHHLLHWRCQVYYVFCLFVADLIFAYTQLRPKADMGSSSCLFLASAMHFFFLAAFFWLNTMCFNIWWTFRDFRPTSLERNQELLRLRLYSAYAWGIPLLITLIAFIMDQLDEPLLLKPGFGDRKCWFNGERLAIFAYFFGPVGILLCINIVLFISTTHMLTCGLWKRDDIKSTTEKTALGKVCLKLVVVMGVTWIADIISWLVGGADSTWFFTDLINALQGVFIFIVVGCQPQVWTAFKRWCWPRSRHENTNTTNGVHHSSSSQGLPSIAACGGELTQNTSMNTSAIGAVNTTITSTTDADNATQTKIPMETVC